MRLGCVKIGNFDDFSTIISPKLCKMGPRLLLITNRKSHTIGTKINDLGWPWIDLERLLCALLHYTRLSEPMTKTWMKIDPYYQRQKCSPGIALSSKIRLMQIFTGVRWPGGFKTRMGSSKMAIFAYFTCYFFRTSTSKATVIILCYVVHIVALHWYRNSWPWTAIMCSVALHTYISFGVHHRNLNAHTHILSATKM